VADLGGCAKMGVTATKRFISNNATGLSVLIEKKCFIH
jgi:hypothetical protein